MIESLVVVTIGALIVLAFWKGIPLALRRAHAGPYADFSDAELDRSLLGLIMFGEDGAYVDIHTVSESLSIRITKSVRSDETTSMSIRILPIELSDAAAEQIERNIDALTEEIRCQRYDRNGRSYIIVEATGSVSTDPSVLEGIANLAIRALCRKNTEEFEVELGGPMNDQKISEFYGV